MQIKSVRKTDAKRSYSQASLDAAVKDIRSGLLGTRRASVVYGIPRSTLRNKIYKLDAAESQNGEQSSSCSRRRRYSMHQSSVNSLRELKLRKKNSNLSIFSTKNIPEFKDFRKYEKKTLEEAVKSVRRGEMSVHRAGSYYGVPHSTLEYKVKERNLSKYCYNCCYSFDQYSP
uniref:HTH psq-type domain-containing protein n=1 Tax=Syphacia muris TaxID=451379 RepID=A0A0N5AGR1_9BILA